MTINTPHAIAIIIWPQIYEMILMIIVLTIMMMMMTISWQPFWLIRFTKRCPVVTERVFHSTMPNITFSHMCMPNQLKLQRKMRCNNIWLCLVSPVASSHSGQSSKLLCSNVSVCGWLVVHLHAFNLSWFAVLLDYRRFRIDAINVLLSAVFIMIFHRGRKCGQIDKFA